MLTGSAPIIHSGEATQSADVAPVTPSEQPEETEPPATEQSSTSTEAPTMAPVVTPTSTTIPTPYYVDQPFGCHVGRVVKHNQNSCRAVRLTISSKRHGVPLMICSQGTADALCPGGAPLSELADNLEWRFVVTNSGTGPVLIRPTVIIGNYTTGELGRALCYLGTPESGVPPDEDDAEKWNVLNGADERISVYCSLISADYSKVDWAVAMVDYDVNGMRYYVSQQYVDTEGQEARAFAEASVLHNVDWKPHVHTEYIAGGDMALVPKGCFTMGREGADGDEWPPHPTCFDHSFWIDVTEVTNDGRTACR